MEVQLPSDLGLGIAEAGQSSCPRTEDFRRVKAGTNEGADNGGRGERTAHRSDNEYDEYNGYNGYNGYSVDDQVDDDSSESPRTTHSMRSDTHERGQTERERKVHSRNGSGEILADTGARRDVKRSRRGHRGDRDGRSERRREDDINGLFPIRTSDGVNTAKIAGKLAWKVRRNEALTPLCAKGPGAIATTMGIISKAREFLEKDDRDLMLIPSVLDTQDTYDRDRAGHQERLSTVIFTLYPSYHRHSIVRRDTDRHGSTSNPTLKVTNRSKVAKVAGAIAGRARDSVGGGEIDEGIWLEAMGDEAAEILMLSLVKGRAYLREGRGDQGGQHASYRVLIHLEQAKADRAERGARGKPAWMWMVKCMLQ